jgi:hypothetical protein
MLSVSNRLVMGVNIINEFRIINWKLAKGLHRCYIVRTEIIFFTRAAVVTIRLYDNYIVRRNKVCNIVAFALVSAVELFIVLSSRRRNNVGTTRA